MKINPDKIEYRQTNWLKMVIDLIAPKFLYLVAGRGMGKTSDVQAERGQEVCYDMPGAPLAFVGDTYMNLTKNTVHTFIEGWERLGWREHTSKQIGHFVVDQRPPDYFNDAYSRLKTYKHTISTITGANFNLVSMDRPSSSAGNNYVHLFGDEVKYFKENKLKKLTPAIRGNAVRFGHSPYFRGRTFTTDYPNVNDVREEDWILNMKKNMDKKQILQILDCAFILNDIRIEYAEAEENQEFDKLKNIARKLERWENRYYKIRKNSTLFYIASSMVNVDNLTVGYFIEQFEGGEVEDYNTSILSMKPSLEVGARFYGNLNPIHFYTDGYNYDYYDQFGLRDNITQDSRGLRYIRTHEKLECGVDFGNMIAMVIGQEQWPKYRTLKNIHVLTPEWIDSLAKHFLTFFKHHKRKELDMRYDRSANAYNKQKQDLATKLKNYIEKQEDSSGKMKPTGWKVNLLSKGQANITHLDEFDLMNDLMSNNVAGLPQLLIDQFECKELKSSLELAPSEKDSKGNIRKIKKSEKLATKRLPMESTNYSDAFKYLMCRKKYMDIAKSRRAVLLGDPKIRG
jgi:hypothetical protein